MVNLYKRILLLFRSKNNKHRHLTNYLNKLFIESTNIVERPIITLTASYNDSYIYKLAKGDSGMYFSINIEKDSIIYTFSQTRLFSDHTAWVAELAKTIDENKHTIFDIITN